MGVRFFSFTLFDTSSDKLLYEQPFLLMSMFKNTFFTCDVWVFLLTVNTFY